MTETDWLNCTNPKRMLDFVMSKVSERKLRLFAVACSRRIWHLLKDARSRAAVEITEFYLEGAASNTERLNAASAAGDAHSEMACKRAKEMLDGEPSAEERAACVAWITAAYDTANAWAVARDSECLGDRRAERHWQSHTLHDLLGNVFLPITIDAAWLEWRDGTVPKLAQSIYEERAFSNLPVVADVLEEAGCASQDILQHCRQPGEHVRGCWVVDLLLNR